MIEKQRQPQESRLPVTATYEIRLRLTKTESASSRFDLYLYNTTRHLATQRASRPFSVELWDTETQRIVALFHADSDGETAVSLPNAPFGGVEFATGIPDEALIHMLSFVETCCREQHLIRLNIKLPPEGYDQARSSFLQEVYRERGFTVMNSFINHHIPVGDDPFIHKIHPSERKRLRKCQRAGFVTEGWDNPDPGEVYSFLAKSRERQGYALSLDFEQLKNLLTELPGEVKVFVVKDGAEIVSLTVAIRVNQRILYNFCPADNLDYRAFSPTVLLNCALYEYAQNEGIELIDLGVSLDHSGNEKASLIRFKENLGGLPSLKLTYSKVLV
ncbi:GNAT family N-acetyltransferase [Persicitalea jodogahamensis]|uniref:BioF2-like acetyltransferase domain-containing protein n=1 Tax=Persicitalea jodogahamensis TaxID=402147 RepID=A0A8J3G893_9BACT|nr:GNAT family N-acetyltransferase [Persicitalea jodogahamensis]GHB56856.1 hypothetical protein GCM10007390_07820 [Persicitalea jodogahamensis]